MPVPDTNTFALSHVIAEVIPAANSLQNCFNDSVAAKFDEKYEGSKDKLSNFRNYGHDGSTFTAMHAYIGPVVALYGSAIHGIKGSNYFHTISNASGNHGIRTYSINSLGTMSLVDTYSGSASRGLWVKSNSEILYSQSDSLRVLKLESGSLLLVDSVSFPFGYEPADLTSSGGFIFVRGDWSAGETEILIYDIDIDSQLSKNSNSLDLGVSIYCFYTQGSYLFFSANVSSENRLYTYKIGVLGDLTYVSYVVITNNILKIKGNGSDLLYCTMSNTYLEVYKISDTGSLSLKDRQSTLGNSTGDISYKKYSNFMFAIKNGYIYAFRTDENDDLVQRAVEYREDATSGDIYADFDNDIIVISDNDFDLRSYRLD